MKKRLDTLLVERKYYPSREKAKANIMAGNVFVDGELSYKAGTFVEEESTIHIKTEAIPYVGRGGLKLEKAIDTFKIDIKDRICMDIGASTGGFTDCMLQKGALKVYAIDVGYGQLDYKLRIDKRVVCMERTNFRYLEKDRIIEEIKFVTIDVSFISLRIIFEKLKEFLKEDFAIVALIKPQFEARREEVGKNGVVRDEKVHKRVIGEILDFTRQNEIYVKGLTFSPVKGQKGNIEYLAYFTNKKVDFDESEIEKVVNSSHNTLD